MRRAGVSLVKGVGWFWVGKREDRKGEGAYPTIETEERIAAEDV